LRVGLPILTACTLALLVAAHLTKGGGIEVDGHAPLGTLKPHTASDDSLFGAVERLVRAKAWFMAFVVACLSGIWPYLKLLATLGLVALADMGTLSMDVSYQGLVMLEVLGKYSFADVILICFNLVIFNISTGGVYNITLVGTLELNLYMRLKSGSILLILAVSASALLTHWAAHVLKPLCAGAGEERERRADDELEAAPLLKDAKDVGQRRRDRPSWLGLAVAVAALLGAVLLLAGSCTPAVEVKRGGFMGNLIRPKEEQDLEISIFVITQKMLEAARTHPSDAVTFYIVLFVILVFLAPLLELVALMVRGISLAFPSSLRRCGEVSEITAAWLSSFAILDVFILVAIPVLTELHTVVDFNMGDECKPFASLMSNGPLLKMAGLGFATSDSCFDPHLTLRSGWWLLLVSVVLRITAWRGVALAMRWRPKHEA